MEPHGLRYLNLVSEETEIDEHISEAIQYMRNHFMLNPSLQEVADHVGYSLSYFKIRFKDEIGITPANYLSILRMEYAKEQLRTSNCSINKLASDLCFSSASHFCAVFKKQTSYTPREYRENHS